MHADTVGRPMEILLVEDGLVDARLTIGALKSGPVRHRLTLVRDGDEALRFLHREDVFARAPRPDLILLDLVLPKKSGLDVLREVRAAPELEKLPVVILTSSDDEEDRAATAELNANQYLTKPVNLANFLAVVQELRTHWFADLILP